MDDGRALTTLPPRFAAWFEARGWAPRSHQLAMVEKARAGRHALLIAPTGGGKTLAGFLPSLIELAERAPGNAPRGIHTLYISPLKALAVDVERNLMAPIAEMGLEVAEYTPNEVKQAVAGYGSAQKRQVQEMVRTLLGLPDIPRPDDAADALAIAITHLNTRRYDVADTQA